MMEKNRRRVHRKRGYKYASRARIAESGMNKKTLIELLDGIDDYRTGNSIRHNLKDVLLIGLLCIICNGDTYTDMELTGKRTRV